uniref:ANK_REP_REGION domain-containing protein n=1 Tax=Anopheles albimanus TaxID=7167 RepID=A0A182FU94_ANOAL
MVNANETGTNRTPLHEAASGGDEAKVESLLASGADRNAKESVHGNTPLHEAAWKGYSRCVKLLCALPKPAKGATTTGTTGVKGLALDLLKDAAKIKHALHDTKGALHSALLGTRNYGGFSALHLAAQNGHNQSCREILLAGGDPDVQNNYGDTPLHTACRYGHAGAIRILLSAKCDYERINLNGDTALHIACAMGRRKLTRILLESGCRQDTKNAQDETARDIALRKNLVEIINILNTPIELSPRRSRERSSSSSHRHQSGSRPPDATDGKPVGRENGHRSRSKEDPSAGAARKSGRRSNSNDERRAPGANEATPGPGGSAEVADPKHWSPYGCHYFPDPRNFPSPKLETLPKEPLGNGEQYFLDLAGNIRKGPVGVGNTCYCAPFFKHLEARMNQNRRSIRKYVHRATEKLDSRMAALAMRTDDQIEELTKSMIANRVQCENKRLHLEQWLKRGIAERSTTTSGTGGTGGHQAPPSAAAAHTPPNSKTKKDEANTNTLTRCRSLELLDDHDHRGILLDGGILADPSHKATSTPTNPQQQHRHHNHQHQHHHLFSRSIDFLDATTIDDTPEAVAGNRHRFQRQHGGLELDALRSMLHYSTGSAGHQSDAFDSSNNSNMKNHSESAPETPPLPDALAHHHRRHQRARSSSVSGRESYSYSSDKDNDREKQQQQQQQQQYVHASNGLTHKARSSANTTPTTSSGGGGQAGVTKSEKAKVTERLEELLSKTKKILELEKLTKGERIGPGGAGSLIGSAAPQTSPGLLSDNRYILALDKLRDIHHHHQYDPTVATMTGAGGRSGARSSRLGLSVASGSPGSTGLGYDIAQEMEKITKSLLPATGATTTATSTAPVSPEIAKDITTRKERPTSVYTSYQRANRTTTTTTTTTGSGSPLSTMSPSSSLLGGQQPMVCDEAQQQQQHHHHIATTNFMMDPARSSSMAPDEESEQEQAIGGGGGGVVVNGFYSNSCFDETLPSSSNTTIKSAPRGRSSGYQEDREQDQEGGDSESEPADEDRSDEDDDDDDDDVDDEEEQQRETVDGEKDTEGSDSDDPGDLSAMANLAELKELKSRILNGTNWRSQVLQKSVQELLAGGGRDEDTDGPPPPADEEDDPATETNRVRYIISKLQQSCSIASTGSEQSVRPVTTGIHTQHHGPPLAQCEDFSDSSEEEDEIEHDEECVDGPLPVKQHAEPGAAQVPSMPVSKVEIEIGTAKSLIQMYEQSNGSVKVPTIGNGPTHYPAPQGNVVPKDAYFHDLPRKPAPYPGQPQEVTTIMVGEQLNPPMLTSRSRNPLPSYLLQEGELFQQQQQQQQEHHLHHHQPLMNGGGPRTQHHHPLPPVPHHQNLGQQPAYHHHHQSRPLPMTRTQLDDVADGHSTAGAQLQERLLSTRKYINPVTLPSLSSTGTPSPEFPLYHHHHQQQQQQQQAQPQQLATAGTASSNHVIGGHSHAMMTMMAAAAAAAASAGRKSADNLSNDDSGYVSGKVSEIHIPSGGASPLLSLPTPAIGSNVMIIPPPPVPSSSSPRHFGSSSSGYGAGGHHHHHHQQQQQQQQLLAPGSNSGAPVMHHRNGGGSVVTSIVPPPVGLGGVAPMTSAAAHAAVEQKQQSLFKLGASSLV